ncbi:MAG: hypothetical protein M3Q07_25950 [Pseudobdellovibrionaceae bacterium]|nr:hypothetical protein [Pseudobdellovibrionaceae bacterium]
MSDGLIQDYLVRLQIFMADRHANSVGELLLFCFALAGLFIFLHSRRNRQGRIDRSAIRLVIGGWGSRGKSGTERLKAALFNSMGRSLLCKTTGCEPVLLYGARFGALEEIPLHRPYDKATIWEQLDVLHIAAEAKVDVFLWECMGLNPEYVKLMQQDWMRDDISTITNTYPDHEDIQGPAGSDVAESIASFIAPGGQVMTTEQLMFPLLEKRCIERNASIEQPTSMDMHGITDEVLRRFPYNEHPHNIALTLALARKMGVSQDYALKEMADRIKPDIGVLRTYPAVIIQGRGLEFSNGFSANEKFACQSNWERLGLSQLTLAHAPKVWLTALVNNREDRVTRSQVFAHFLAHDLDLDRMYLVGTNLDGFESFYFDTVRSLVMGLNLKTADDARSILLEYGRRLRIPETREVLDRRVHGLPPHNEISRTFQEWQSLLDELSAAPYAAPMAEKIRNFLVRCFRHKLVKVAPDTDVRTLLSLIISTTPEGFENKMHGMQNIKGIGLLWLELWEQLGRLEKQQRISNWTIAELKAFAQSTQLMDNPLCAAFLEEGVQDAPAPVLPIQTLNQRPPNKFRMYTQQKIKHFAKPNLEMLRSRRIKAIYRDFAGGRRSAAEVTAEIRRVQGEY